MTKFTPVGSFRGQYSPTVVRAYLANPNWFDFAIKENASSPYDLEGYNQFGYNCQGVDRAGLGPESFKENFYYEPNDDLIDAGEELFIRTVHDWSFLKDASFYLVVRYQSIQYACTDSAQDLSIFSVMPNGLIEHDSEI